MCSQSGGACAHLTEDVEVWGAAQGSSAKPQNDLQWANNLQHATNSGVGVLGTPVKHGPIGVVKEKEASDQANPREEEGGVQKQWGVKRERAKPEDKLHACEQRKSTKI
jgi:hypothetical protein